MSSILFCSTSYFASISCASSQMNNSAMKDGARHEPSIPLQKTRFRRRHARERCSDPPPSSRPRRFYFPSRYSGNGRIDDTIGPYLSSSSRNFRLIESHLSLRWINLRVASSRARRDASCSSLFCSWVSRNLVSSSASFLRVTFLSSSTRRLVRDCVEVNGGQRWKLINSGTCRMPCILDGKAEKHT